MAKIISQSEHIHNYDDITARLELYDELKKGLDDIVAGRTIPAEEVHTRLAKKFEGYDLKWHIPFTTPQVQIKNLHLR